MNILITGGTGFVGSALTGRLLALGHTVTVIGSSRQCRLPSHQNLTYIPADTTHPGPWQQQVASQNALINLAGRSVFHLWTEAYKQSIYNSRIRTTKNLVQALPANSNAILLSASAAGYYGDGGEAEKDETCKNGDDFLARVCHDWEEEALKASEKGARVALMRFGVVLGKGGGAIGTMTLPFKLGLGGPIGNGNQWFPWIHLDDLLAALLFLLDAPDCRGPFNFTAQQPVRQKEFARQLGKTVHRPAFLPAPAFLMQLALGEFGRSLLQGQRVIPRALNTYGFSFTYPELHAALKEILGD